MDISNFELDYESLSNSIDLGSFVRQLETRCYKFIPYYIPKGDFDKLFIKFDILELDSFDIHDRPDQNRDNPEKHTLIWDKFLNVIDGNGGVKTRLNPEFSIYKRNIIDTEPTSFVRLGVAETRVNRRNNSKLRIFFSISENTNKQVLKLPKGNEKQTKQNITFKQIQDFNDTFNSDLKNKFFDSEGYATFYGIDRGSDEMATVCKVKLNPNALYNSPAMNKNNPSKFPLYEPKFEGFEYYKIKDGVNVADFPGLLQLLKNPSSYLTEFENRIIIFNHYFILVTGSCLDFSKAKLIKSHYHNKSIILEVGDLYTFLKFSIETAKSKIHTLITEKGISQSELTWGETKNTWNLGSQEIYYFNTGLEVQTANAIKSTLEEYIIELKTNLKLTKIFPNSLEKTKLWNLKKSLSANAIGIMNFLYQKDSGFLVIENLNSGLLESQTKDKTSIHRQLEQALYQKWQTYGTVPPKINMPNMWKQLFDIKQNDIQLGCILLVDESGTSKDCPRCGVTNKEYNIKQDSKLDVIDQKWVQHRFGCVGVNTGDCGFDTGSNKANLQPNLLNLSGLTTPDATASYNIAKRGMNFLDIGNTVIKQNNNLISNKNESTRVHRNPNIKNHERNNNN